MLLRRVSSPPPRRMQPWCCMRKWPFGKNAFDDLEIWVIQDMTLPSLIHRQEELWGVCHGPAGMGSVARQENSVELQDTKSTSTMTPRVEGCTLKVSAGPYAGLSKRGVTWTLSYTPSLIHMFCTATRRWQARMKTTVELCHTLQLHCHQVFTDLQTLEFSFNCCTEPTVSNPSCPKKGVRPNPLEPPWVRAWRVGLPSSNWLHNHRLHDPCVGEGGGVRIRHVGSPCCTEVVIAFNASEHSTVPIHVLVMPHVMLCCCSVLQIKVQCIPSFRCPQIVCVLLPAF